MRIPFRPNDGSAISEEEAAIRAFFLEAFGQWPTRRFSRKKALRLGLVKVSGEAIEQSLNAFERCFPISVAKGAYEVSLGELAQRLPDFGLPHLDAAEKALLPLAGRQVTRTAIDLVRAERSERPDAPDASDAERDIDMAIETGRPVTVSVLKEWANQFGQIESQSQAQLIDELHWAVWLVAAKPFSKELETSRAMTIAATATEDSVLQGAMNASANVGIAFRILEEPLVDHDKTTQWVFEGVRHASESMGIGLETQEEFWAAARDFSAFAGGRDITPVFREGFSYRAFLSVHQRTLDVLVSSDPLVAFRIWTEQESELLRCAEAFGYVLRMASHYEPGRDGPK